LLVDGSWKTIRCVSMDSASEGKMSAYRVHREQTGLDAGAHYALARWCRSNGLADQEWTHILFALQLMPRHIHANKRLTQLQLQNKETVAYQQKRAKQETLDVLKAMHEWRSQIVHLRCDAESDDRSRRSQAYAELAAIRDLTALPAIEGILGNANSE